MTQQQHPLEKILTQRVAIIDGAMGTTIRTYGMPEADMRDTRFQTFTQAVALLENALDTLPPLIHLPQTRTLAGPRIQSLRAFLASAHSEGADLLF